MTDATQGSAAEAGRAVEAGPLDVLRAACWFGAVAGLTELGWILVVGWVTGRITNDTLRTNWHFAWMVPASNLALFGVLGGMLALLAWAWPRARAQAHRIAVYLFVFASALMLALGVPGLHRTAAAALAAGVASQVGGQLTRRPEGLRRLIRWTLPPLAAGVLALTAWQAGSVGLAETRSLAGLPPTTPGAPNILLIVLDTVRADALSFHGSARDTTPSLARLARRGVRFDEARSTAPWTLPSHASLFTGHWPHEVSIDAGRPLDGTHPTLAGFLQSRGYATAGFVANTPNCNAWYGLARGFAHYEDYYENTTVTPLEVLRASRLGRTILMSKVGQRVLKFATTPPRYLYRKSAAMINRDALAWLARQPDRPFFLFLNYFDAHDPYEPPPGAARPFSSPAIATPNPVRDAYDDCLAYLDSQLDQLFDALETRGALRNTLVIVTADHGEEIGDHGLTGHGISLYRPELHVPLLVVFPDHVPSGVSVPHPVSLRDVPATVVALAGQAAGAPFPGRSLARFWTTDARGSGGDVPDDPVLSEVRPAVPVPPRMPHAPILRGPMRSIQTRDWSYIRNGDGQEELYNRNDDPLEQHNLIAQPGLSASVENLRMSLNRLLDARSAPGANADPRKPAVREPIAIRPGTDRPR